MTENKTRARVLISGRVQGVFFRSETRKTAERLDLSGWVRNTRDGQVEAVFEGDAGKVEEVIRWCRTGPPAARVENVEMALEEYRGEFNAFSIER